MLPDWGAPVIFMEPPPVTESQTLEVRFLCKKGVKKGKKREKKEIKYKKCINKRKFGEKWYFLCLFLGCRCCTIYSWTNRRPIKPIYACNKRIRIKEIRGDFWHKFGGKKEKKIYNLINIIKYNYIIKKNTKKYVFLYLFIIFI